MKPCRAAEVCRVSHVTEPSTDQPEPVNSRCSGIIAATHETATTTASGESNYCPAGRVQQQFSNLTAHTCIHIRVK